VGVLTYALGISIPTQGNDQGLTPAEVREQHKQLLGFVNGDQTRFINFDQQGYNALQGIADAFVDRLPNDVEANFANVAAKPWYCGFSNHDVSLYPFVEHQHY
jgi:hypothetical protein